MVIIRRLFSDGRDCRFMVMLVNSDGYYYERLVAVMSASQMVTIINISSCGYAWPS